MIALLGECFWRSFLGPGRFLDLFDEAYQYVCRVSAG